MEADTGDYECWAQADSETAQQVKKILKVGLNSNNPDNHMTLSVCRSWWSPGEAAVSLVSTSVEVGLTPGNTA